MDLQDDNLEYLQDIIVRTDNGDRLDVQVNKFKQYYRLSGFFFRAKDAEWEQVKFDRRWANDPLPLIETALARLQKHLNGNGDSIKSLDNPCNAPYVSEAQQRAILQELESNAEVRVNGKSGLDLS